MRFALLAALALAFLQAQDRRVPVIVELFTSEGCSSCPPADLWLARLERSQPVAGARVIALEEHVDYWNQLGWVDPFSAPHYRGRQNDYALAFHAENIYTPQMIVNGQVQVTGDDTNRGYQIIAKQTQTTLVDLKNAANAKDPDLVDLAVQVTNPKNPKPHAEDVYLAVTEKELESQVLGGENAGRRLRHAPVVRSFGIIGRIDPNGSNVGQITNTLRLPREWKRENLRAVVFVQEHDTLRITGAATAELR
ncbi:MAG TPA: DUF1223 domain-containing protein [Bryobacteraceae bacterium]|nr:DUF1223 domain-containing protein [Bryobacteraceae bacterium]